MKYAISNVRRKVHKEEVGSILNEKKIKIVAQRESK